MASGSDSPSSFSTSRYSPFGDLFQLFEILEDLKSGIPAETLIPAPVKASMFWPFMLTMKKLHYIFFPLCMLLLLQVYLFSK